MEVVRGTYGVVGTEVPLVGGCAGEDLRMQATHQLFGDQALKGTVVCAAVGSDAPIGIGVQHGWRKVGEPLLVTASGANRVHTLDDPSALDVYLQRLDAPPEAATDFAAFTRFALTHPLGLSRRSGEEVRFVAEATSPRTPPASCPSGHGWSPRLVAKQRCGAMSSALEHRNEFPSTSQQCSSRILALSQS